MTVTFTKAQKVDALVWEWEWTSNLTNPTYYLYGNGVLIGETTHPQAMLTLSPNESFQFEVLDDPDAVPAFAYPSRAFLQWYLDEDDPAERYDIDEYVGGQWVSSTPPSIKPGFGQTYFQYQTRVLEDQTTHIFRVTPVAADERAGVPVIYTFFIVRLPDPPTVSYSYSASSGDVTMTVS